MRLPIWRRTMPLGTLSIRTNQSNPTHHLYRNGNLWWVHFFVHHSEFKARRVRKSLKTGSLSEAITRRDKLFNGIRKNGHLIPERKTSRGDWTRTSDFSAPRAILEKPQKHVFLRDTRTLSSFLVIATLALTTLLLHSLTSILGSQ